MDNTENPQDNQPQQPNAKQQIELARGKNVPIDYFLYSCLEHERTQRAQFGDDMPTAGRWPLMVGATKDHAPPEFAAIELKGLMTRMCLWYAAQYPEMVEEIPLDHEVLNQVVAPFMRFTLDLADLVLLKTEKSLPSHNAATEESMALWNLIAEVLKEEMPGYHGYFIRFLKWAFADIEPQEFEPGSRPPVGKNMPNFRSMQSSGGGQGHQGGGGHRDNRGPRDSGGGGHRPQHQGRQGQGGPQGGGHRDNRGPRDSGGPRDNNRGPRDNNPRNHNNKPKFGGPGPSNQQADAETEKMALGAVDEAISKIQSGSVEEVFLKPVNSFYRRIQHQYAVDKGFESCSVGDGNERGVKVSKPLK